MEAGQVLAAITFAAITLGMGHTVFYLTGAKRNDHPGLALLETAMVGLALFSFTAVLLDLLHIPLHFIVYLVLAAAVPLYHLVRSQPSLAWQKWKSASTAYLAILFIVLAVFFTIFNRGANAYPYLEDDDPWSHAQATVYVGREMTYSIDPEVSAISPNYSFYLEPYPPTYDAMMGVLWQMNKSVVWTLKFFNVILATLAIAFFYMLALEYFKSEMKAIFAAIIIAALPSFMSHFIWSQTLAVTMLPVALYTTLKGLTDTRWAVVAALAIASMMVTQPVVSAVYGVTMIMMVGFVFLHELIGKEGPAKKRFSMTINGLAMGIAGLAISFLFWGKQMVKWGVDGVIGGHGGGFGAWNMGYVLQQYTLSEVIFPPHTSRIDQAVGWGPVLFALVIITAIVLAVKVKRVFDIKRTWSYWFLTAWFVLLLYMTFGPTFGLPAYGSSRSWPYLALPLVLFATEGAFIVINSLSKKTLIRIGVAAAVLIAVVATSLPAKIAVQTATWPPGVQWTYIQNAQGNSMPVDLAGHLEMRKRIPQGSRVFAFCGVSDQRAIGFGMESEPWDMDLALFRTKGLNVTGEETVEFLQRQRFEYITIDAACVRDHGSEALDGFVQRISTTGRFIPVIQSPGFLLAKFT